MHPRRPIPWLTFLVVTLTLLAWDIPGAAALLIYDRTAITHGEIWRLWTGHLCHFTPSHLGWDLFATALVIAWIESADFPGGRVLWLVAPPLISLTLLMIDPALQYYGGLSGMATACTVFAAMGALHRPGAYQAFWRITLATLILKVGWECLTGESVFARFGGTAVRFVPLSHAAGALVAAGFSLACRAFVRGTGPAAIANKKLTNVAEWQH